MRFDFSHLEAMTAAEIKQVERLVNAQIRLNHVIETHVMDIESAKQKARWRCLARNTMNKFVSCRWVIFRPNYVVVFMRHIP